MTRVSLFEIQSMYVCLCKGVTESQLRQVVEAGATNLRQVRQQTGVASQCGKCTCHAREILLSTIQENSLTPQESLCYQLV